MKKRFLVFLASLGLGALAWWRLRGREETVEPVAEPAPPPGKLGGEVDPELLAILACPLDKAPVSRQGDYIVCSQCGRQYPIRDGIPVMLVEEAILPEQPPAGEEATAALEPEPEAKSTESTAATEEARPEASAS